ncbi:hypothetical protein QBC34DRAFT_416558 [Podospora aff. communis PSN243]|uniref:Uncharacterized protein n=1 Tax=Podospora aff. communis PSN243 TaxID=3040156 RepID=A0AAV9G4G6_9PEZI|nr:hypothetical protein QBC34DRAFT_416558 [Podospora aff. communis PSN243]
MLYASEAWWNGTERQSFFLPNKVVGTGHTRKVDDLNRCLLQAIRGALPVWRTTPTPILHRESGIPHTTTLLEAARLRYTRRIHLLDDKHPIVQRTYNDRYKPDSSRRKPKTKVTDKRTRLEITADLLGDMKKPLPLQTPTNPVDNTD